MTALMTRLEVLDEILDYAEKHSEWRNPFVPVPGGGLGEVSCAYYRPEDGHRCLIGGWVHDLHPEWADPVEEVDAARNAVLWPLDLPARSLLMRIQNRADDGSTWGEIAQAARDENWREWAAP